MSEAEAPADPNERKAYVLNAEPGAPGARESSLGGPPLWPTDEPWPYCAQEDHWTYGSDVGNTEPIVPGAVPMVPVLQLFARDVPGLEFPVGTDVLQVVWCALNHDDGPFLVSPRLFWRDGTQVVAGGMRAGTPVAREGEYDEDNVPEPSTVSPTVVPDRPSRWEHGNAPQGGGASYGDDEEGEGGHVVASKAGGWPAWTQPANWPDCAEGHRMEHLLTLTGDIQLGDCGGVYFFRCRRCPGHPWDWRGDCH
ncbi:DUF1963 domain-containing protein [Streptomyces sp. NPDC058657]|uniref:DUF1963 domain-containing protein n=1 Tax=unclassified Streptomyces TaxID=2593676 RepID=UPI00364897AD